MLFQENQQQLDEKEREISGARYWLEQEQNKNQDLQGQFQQQKQQLEAEQRRRECIENQLRRERRLSEDLQERLDKAPVEMQQPTNTSFTRANRSDVAIEGPDPVGEGAWGKVEKGRFKGNLVAVKSVHPAILVHHSTVDRLRREMAIMAQIHHPNLVRFVAAVLDGPAERLQAPPLILTELLDTNLRRAYEEKRIFPAHHLGILRDVAYGLHHLHSLQTPIIHRDVSAPNILLKQLPNSLWLAKVSDFGSANFAKLAKTMGEGAIIYSAPEAIPATASDDSEPPAQLTTKVDVFSYGMVACELVAEKMPVPEKFRAMLREVERKWKFMHGLIVRCTERDPLERPSMVEILNEIPCPTPQSTNKVTRRHLYEQV